MSFTISNSTNATLPTTSSAANSSNVAATNIVSNLTAPINTTSNNHNTSAKNDDAMVTLLTFGPLSSCINLPNLAAQSLPVTANLSSTAQQQIVQSWLTSLPTTSSCTTLSWTLRPDYSDHLNSMAIFQSQLEQLLPASKSTVGASKTMEVVQPGTFAAGIGNVTDLNNTSAAAVATATVGSFFGRGTASSDISGLNDSNVTLPTGLPLWIGVVIASSALVHLLSFIIHICSDLEALFPSLASNMQEKPKDPNLLPSNQCSATQVAPNNKPPSDPNVKVADPLSYIEPVTISQGLSVENGVKPIPAIIRYTRKAKRLMVPMLLLSALGTIAVAVVINSKFAAGPVGRFPSSLSSVGSSVPLTGVIGETSGANVENNTTMGALMGHSSSGRSSRISLSDGYMTSDKGTDVDRISSTIVDVPATTKTTTTTTTTIPSMTKLVRRQTNFFPTPTSIDTNPSLAIHPTPTASFSSSSNSPLATTTSAASTPNASLFPPTNPSPSTPTTTSESPSTSTTPTIQSIPTNSSPSVPLFVVTKADSIHRLWWIVMLNSLLWFTQRRRTRHQSTLDNAHSAILATFSNHQKHLQHHQLESIPPMK